MTQRNLRTKSKKPCQPKAHMKRIKERYFKNGQLVEGFQPTVSQQKFAILKLKDDHNTHRISLKRIARSHDREPPKPLWWISLTAIDFYLLLWYFCFNISWEKSNGPFLCSFNFSLSSSNQIFSPSIFHANLYDISSQMQLNTENCCCLLVSWKWWGLMKISYFLHFTHVSQYFPL